MSIFDHVTGVIHRKYLLRFSYASPQAHRSVNIKNYNSKIQDFVSLVYTARGEGGVAIEQTLFHFEIP